MITGILILAALAILFIGTFTDFRIREVPDWVNYSGIAIGIGLRLIYSSATFDWSILYAGLLGFAVFYLFALFMFYMGQWGGGDAKMLMALGALIGLEFRPDGILVSFFVNMLIVGALYGIFWAFWMAFVNRKKFVKEAEKVVKSKNFFHSKIGFLVMSFGLVLISLFIQDTFLRLSLIVLAIALIVTFYLWTFVKIVEKCCMLKVIPVERLTEGDWIVKDVVISGKKVCGPKDLGISKEQIKKLMTFKRKGKIKEILIKEGMPFVPSFLIAYIITLIFGNLVLLLI